MHFFTSISLASAFISLSSALPTLNQRSSDFCPGMLRYAPGVECPSGFLGCVAYEKGDETCGGPKRFYNDCSGGPGLGSFFKCSNGFVGCSTNPSICDTKPNGVAARSAEQTQAVPSPAPGTCREGEGSWYVCANGFKGCSTNWRVCDTPANPPAPVVNPSTSTQPSTSGQCPAGSTFYVCASNGFRGCSSNPRICDPVKAPTAPVTPPSVAAPPSSSVSSPSSPSSWTCPQNTWYTRINECSSGFVGCSGDNTVCGGPKRFWGSCPPNHGNYYNCANGFVGCTTNTRICG